MYTQNVTINNEVGLHARPATFFIQKANEFKSGIWLEKDERRVNAKSLLGVLSLGIVKGTTITLLADGADVRRVEQTLSRMGKAYGAVRMDVFVITSSIVLTMCFADGSAATQTRRIEKSAMTDFGKLEAINAISRSYCEHPFPVPELYDRLQLAKRCEPARWKLFAGSCLAAGALAAFFGGTALDGLAAGLFALVLCVLQIVLPPLCKNKVLFNFLSAFAVGGLICLACRLVPALHSDKVIIGDIMLLIPGLAFTNAVKDIFIGDTISGVMRLIETILWAAALALGFALAGWLLGV